MENNQSKSTPQESHAIVVEDIISQSLRWGVVISAVIIAAGLVLYLLTGDSGYPAGFFPTSPLQALRDVVHFKSFAIIDLGLLLLIATPIFRVAASIIAFIFDRDRPYVLITTYVLAMLILSLLLGKAE
ncbi:DUF1634 domain-containing protein [Neomoorella mulderi]|uniref:DUF1634 domain-containing protein n=1 Tax=Moorella mulderi DSM 14980 TaxID=1122241 RepID=A0A151AUB5_9FIRM|nr:DUF1634 domain-containing protein [Moorella mulderi]KYH31191.1 hypothetical protein MOMUL_25720 [Moorella mulderi DSM 14980]